MEATMGRNVEPKWLPLDKIKTVRGYIDEELDNGRELLGTLLKAWTKPHVMDDALLDRVARVNKKKREDLWMYRGQMEHWLGDKRVSEADKKEIEGVGAQVKAIEEIYAKMLSLADELREGSINRIMEMDDMELAMRTLMGNIKPPKGS
jgi:hypothetical protein